MIYRLAITIGGIAAAAVLAIGFAASSFGPSVALVDAAQPTVGIGQSGVVEAVASQTNPRTVTRIKTTTVYVRPAPKAKVVHVTRHAPPAKHATPAKHAKVIRETRTVPAKHSDDEGDDHDDDEDEDHGDDRGEHEPGDD